MAAAVLGMAVLLGVAGVLGIGLGIWHLTSTPSAESRLESASESLVPPGVPQAGPTQPVGPRIPDLAPEPDSAPGGGTPRSTPDTTTTGSTAASADGSAGAPNPNARASGAAPGGGRGEAHPNGALGHPVSVPALGARPGRGHGTAARVGRSHAAVPATAGGNRRLGHHGDSDDQSDDLPAEDREDGDRDELGPERAPHQVRTSSPGLLGLLDALDLG